MLVAVPNITPSSFAINALFIQPTGFCKRNCNGCYVKNFTPELSATENSIVELLLYLNTREGPSANQTTFALDALSLDLSESNIMIKLFRLFLSTRESGIKAGAEYHITVHTVSDFLEYLNLQAGIGTDLEFSLTKERLDLLSISHINLVDLEQLPFLRTLAKQINWNLTIDPSVNTRKTKFNFVQIAQEVDHVYVVLHKPSTGLKFNPDAFLQYQDFLGFIKTLPIEIQNKVTIDGCVTDSKKFLSTGYGCSSNVSRFQVWPDGSVTGCAYNQKRLTPGAKDYEEICKNIYAVSKMYEFSKCEIPNYLDPTNKFVEKRTKSYLQILE